MIHTYAAYERPTTEKKTYTDLKESVGKKFQTNGQGKKARVAIFISDKFDFKTRAIKGDPEGHFITVKEIIHQ